MNAHKAKFVEKFKNALILTSEHLYIHEYLDFCLNWKREKSFCLKCQVHNVLCLCSNAKFCMRPEFFHKSWTWEKNNMSWSCQFKKKIFIIWIKSQILAKYCFKCNFSSSKGQITAKYSPEADLLFSKPTIGWKGQIRARFFSRPNLYFPGPAGSPKSQFF